MKKGIITELDWEYIGAVFATEDDAEQAKFFKSMLKEMGTWDTSHQSQTQLANINEQFTEDEKEQLQMLSYTEPTQ